MVQEKKSPLERNPWKGPSVDKREPAPGQMASWADQVDEADSNVPYSDDDAHRGKNLSDERNSRRDAREALSMGHGALGE